MRNSTSQSTLVGALASLLTLVPSLSMAETAAGSQELSAFAGALFGDKLTRTGLPDEKPELDDEFIGGLRFSYNLSSAFAAEVSVGFSPGKVSNASRGDIDMDLTVLEVDAVYHFSGAGRLVPYVTAGVGYAWADLDEPITGDVGGNPVTIDDDDGYTLNVGGGVKYAVTDDIVIRLDARYRYFDGLVDELDESLDAAETTIGIGWRF